MKRTRPYPDSPPFPDIGTSVGGISEHTFVHITFRYSPEHKTRQQHTDIFTCLIAGAQGLPYQKERS